MKKPAGEKVLHVNALFVDNDDGPPGLVEYGLSSEDGLDMGVLFTGDGDLSDVASDLGDLENDSLLLDDDISPLLHVVRTMMQQMPSHFYGHFLETWKILAALLR